MTLLNLFEGTRRPHSGIISATLAFAGTHEPVLRTRQSGRKSVWDIFKVGSTADADYKTRRP